MAFFGGMNAWRGSSWSPWSGLGSDSDSDSDTNTTTTTAQRVQTTTPSPTIATATATVVQQVTTTAVSVITPSSSTPKPLTVTQTPKPSSSPLPSATTTNANPPSSTQQQQQQQQSSTGAASSTQSSQASSSVRPSSSASTSAGSTDSSDGSEVPDDWLYYGCVPNLDGMPILNTTYATSDELTPSLCISACAASQYHFAGLQNGNACFCGSTITYPSLSPSPSPSSSCSSSCSGDPTGSSKCGGPSSMSFYHLRYIDPNSLSSSDLNNSSTLTSLSDEYGVGSTTIVAKLPEFTGTLMEYGDPNFRSGRDGVVFGEMFKVSSSSLRSSLNLDGIGWIVLLGWLGLRVLR